MWVLLAFIKKSPNPQAKTALFSKFRHGANADDAARWDLVPTKIQMNEVLSTDIIVTESVTTPDKEVK